jgi:rRNA maturation protein Nop10
MEVINCQDCRRSVSFSATRCPHCGSTEPAGPYRFSKKEARKYRIEDRNDNNLVATSVTFGIIGVVYGIAINIPSVIWATIGAVCYGLLGVLVGVPTAGAFNMMRNLRYFLIPIGLVTALLLYHFGIFERN